MTQRFFSPLRMLLPPSDLSLFNNTVTPIEVEAYDILKYRSSACDTSWVNYNKQISSEQSWLRSLLFSLLCIAVRTPLLRSPMSGRAPKRRLITPIPGQQLLRPFGFMFKMLWKQIFDFFSVSWYFRGVLVQITGEALSSTMLRRWRRRATCWRSWRGSVCPGPGGPGRGPTPPGPSPRCWTSQWTDTPSPETSDPPPPAPCFQTGCWPATRTPTLASAQTSGPSARSTSTKSRCTRLQTEGGPRPETDTPKAKRIKVERGVKTVCSRCRVLLAGVARCCRRCSVQVPINRRGANRWTDIRPPQRTDSTAPSPNRSTSSKLSASPRPNSRWVNDFDEVWLNVWKNILSFKNVQTSLQNPTNRTPHFTVWCCLMTVFQQTSTRVVWMFQASVYQEGWSPRFSRWWRSRRSFLEEPPPPVKCSRWDDGHRPG